MKFIIKNITQNPTTALRRAGYTFQHHTDRGEMSFVRMMARGGYPRFHMYVTIQNRDMHISFHIDHKKHTYGNDTRHHGEYDTSQALTDEAHRLQKMIY